jgi:hypothetical protein
LAGDPQSTVHAGIVVGIVLWCRHRWPAPTQVVADSRAIVSRCGVLVAAAMFGGLLSCVQLGLTREFMLPTTRYTDIVPVSLWDVAGGGAATTIVPALLRVPVAEERRKRRQREECGRPCRSEPTARCWRTSLR